MAGTFAGAYAEAGYSLSNPRNQWSAIKDDGSGVALTIWSDEIDKSTEPWEMDLRGHSKLDLWRRKPGNSIRMRHIEHALENLNGEVDLILCVAEDPLANPRRVKVARHWHQRYGRIHRESYNPETGEFQVKLIPAP